MDKICKAWELARHDNEELFKSGKEEPAPNTSGSSYRRAERQPVSPSLLRKNRLVALGSDAVADAYRLLRTRILNMMKRDGWKVLGITSAGGQEGKSLTAANLAISMAREPETTVLLMDADLRRPSQHRYFGLNVTRGLADYLRSDVPVERILIDPGIDRLLILPGSSKAKDAPELLGSKKMAALINGFKKQSDLRCIIVDLPPVLVGDDALVLSPHLDAVLLVVDEGRTVANELSKSIELLDRVNVVGTVLNRSPDVAHQTYRN